jgi:hypothetical protein
MKIGETGLTLEELFPAHAIYFGFCSISGHRLLEEMSAFVTDGRRNAAFKLANGEYFTEEEFWRVAKAEILLESHIYALPALKLSYKLSFKNSQVDCGITEAQVRITKRISRNSKHFHF